MNKISIITVTYNAKSVIENTILSVINQSYKNFEYIVIDGASSDGTTQIIKKYSQYIHQWISEKDNGLYDAMNKGIEMSTGDWIFFINAGDYFTSTEVLKNIFENENHENIDVLYGNAIERKNGTDIKRGGKIISSKIPPEYRHGASFVRSSVHKKYKFDLSKTKILNYALDYQCIYSIYKSGCIFKKINADVIIYDSEGISNHPIKNKWYRTLIQNDCKKDIQFYYNLTTNIIISTFRKIPLLKNTILSIYWFFTDYILNHVFFHIPLWYIRKLYLILCGSKIRHRSQIDLNCTILEPKNLTIGNFVHINRKCLLDARGGLQIGNNVSISQQVSIVTGSHDLNSPDFTYIKEPIFIDEYVWIGINSTILGGVKIGKGAVICAGSVVTKDVEEYSIVAGIPAKKIGNRNKDLKYKPLNGIYYWPMFT